MTSITPFLWFDTDLAEPVAFYRSVFPDASDGEGPGGGGPVHSAAIELCGQKLMLLNGGPVHAGFTESISLFVSVDTQAEIDRLWDRLGSDGGEPGRCGWLKDRYGLSWQIVPSVLGSLLGSNDRRRAQQALEAMLAMAKLDIAALQAAYDREADRLMRFMLLQSYGPAASGMDPIHEWSEADVQAHIEFQIALNRELAALGELVDAQGLAGPDAARFVVADGVNPPVASDGPFPETKELVAGYRIVEVSTPERAIEIAARISAAPGRAGAPVSQPIEVRQVLSAPELP